MRRYRRIRKHPRWKRKDGVYMTSSAQALLRECLNVFYLSRDRLNSVFSFSERLGEDLQRVQCRRFQHRIPICPLTELENKLDAYVPEV